MTIPVSRLALPVLFALMTPGACQEAAPPPEAEALTPELTPEQSRLAAFKAEDPWTFGQGEAMAETICAACHAIGLDDLRPHPDAPAFRDLSASHSMESLRDRFIQGIMTEHPAMLDYQFERGEVDALIYYISALQPGG
ncbi:MAG: cytochrome c [Pseudomonadota bacterium]